MIVSRERIRAFAALTGDDAPIHRDASFARAAGFAAPIAQGLWVAAWVERQQAGASPFEIRLLRTVTTDDELRVTFDEAATDGSRFEVANQRDEVVARGRIGGDDERVPKAVEPVGTPPPPAVWYAEDLVDHFPARVQELPAVTRDDVERFDALFESAEASGGSAPASLTFARGFATFLQALLACPLPDAASAGHVGDRWIVHRLARVGEALRVRYGVATLTLSRSRPGLAVVEFAIELSDDHGALIEGVAAIMIAARPAPA